MRLLLGWQRIRWRRPSLAFLVVFGISLLIPTYHPPPANTSTLSDPLPANASQLQELQYAINVYRYAHGLPTVYLTPHLLGASNGYAVRLGGDCAFSHTDGSTLQQRTWGIGYPVVSIAEILAANAPVPAVALDLWLGSPEHKAILDMPDWHGAGVSIVAYAPGCQYQSVWVVDFGAVDER